jgi:ABC-type amino acid transport substrate-binding protein
MVYIYNAPESTKDTRYLYSVEILKATLESTRERFGDYRIEPSAPMSEERQVSELRNNTGAITVIVRGATLDYAKQLHSVNIAIDKGILGYRALLIRRQDQPRFDQLQSLDDLKKISIGQGSGWKDIEILTANGLKVITGPSYEGLFEMLTKGRFDAFSRSVDEVVAEYEERKIQLPDLAIEKHLLLHYPIPRYFWFNRGEAGERLAARVDEGLRKIIANGTLDRIFRQHFQARLELLKLGQRRLIEIRNPYLPPGIPQRDETFPFDFSN